MNMGKVICASLMALAMFGCFDEAMGAIIPQRFDVSSECKEIIDLSRRFSSLSIRESLSECRTADPYFKKLIKRSQAKVQKAICEAAECKEIIDLSRRFSSLSIRESLSECRIANPYFKKLIERAQAKVQKAICKAAGQSECPMFIFIEAPLLNYSVPAVCQAIRILQLKVFACNCSCLNGEGIAQIKEAIGQNTTLRKVFFCGGPYDSEWTTAIIDILNSDSNIEKLVFPGVIDVDNVGAFANALINNTPLRCLRLANFSSFNHKVRKRIRKAIEAKPNLETEGF